MNKKDFKLVSEYENTAKTYRALLEKGDIKLQIEAYSNTSAKQATDFNLYKSMQILSLYESVRSPYPGVISDQVACAKEYQPVFKKTTINNINIESYSGYVNDRLQFGSCTKEQIAYRGMALMFYCPKQNRWYHLEFMTSPLQAPIDFQRLIQSISCTST